MNILAHRSLRNVFISAMLSLALLSTECAAVSQWWQNFQKNPVAQVQAFLSEVQTVLNILEGAWNFISPLLPASILPAAQQQYSNAVTSVGHAEAVLQDAVTADIAAQQSSPDLTAFVAAVSDALNQVIAIIDTYKGNANVSVPDAGPTGIRVIATIQPPGLEEARTRTAHLRTYQIGVR